MSAARTSGRVVAAVNARPAVAKVLALNDLA
jgi:hypothetical protein